MILKMVVLPSILVQSIWPAEVCTCFSGTLIINKQIKLMAQVIAFMKSFDDARHVLNSVI